MAQQEMPAYIRGYLEKKEHGKWKKYWTVIKGTMIFFFIDPNTHIQEHFAGSISLSPQTKSSTVKSKRDIIFEIKTDGKKTFIFRCENDLRRTQWLFAIDLSSRLQPPSALPGEESFDSSPTVTPNLYSSVEFNDSKPMLSRSQTLPTKNKLSYLMKSQPETELTRRRSIDGAEAMAESTYDLLKLGDGSWYVGNLARLKAEDLLLQQPVGTFVVRDSESSHLPGSYTLSVRRGERVFHHKIETQSLGLILKGHEQYKFKDLNELVKFFAEKQKDIKIRPYSTASESSNSRTSSFNEDPEYECPIEEEEEEVFTEYENMPGPRGLGDGQDYEPKPVDETLATEMTRLKVNDRMDPNVNHVPLPSTPPCKDDISYIHMSPSTEKKFVPIRNTVDSEYLPMGPITSPDSPDGDSAYLNMSPRSGPDGGDPEYINMDPNQETLPSDAQSYVNMPPPLNRGVERANTPPLPPRRDKTRSQSVYNIFTPTKDQCPKRQCTSSSSPRHERSSFTPS